MSSQGKAYTKEQKEFIVRLKQSYNNERAVQASVSNYNAVCQGLIQKVRAQEDQYWVEDDGSELLNVVAL
jgi:hypothetical protein